MNAFRWQAIFVLAAVLAAPAGAPAQPPRRQQDPHIGYVYPAGARQNTTLEVTVGGQYLSGVTEAHVSGGGVRATVVKYLKHLTRQEAGALRRRLQSARERLTKKNSSSGKKGWIARDEVAKEAGVTADELAAIEDYQQREADPRRQPNAQLMEEITLKITLGPDAKPGEREIRLISPLGMSNPVYFHVGLLPEFRETEPNDKTADKAAGYAVAAVLNGRIMPGDVDRFVIKARQGERLVIAAAARELIPYLADAVPGWFQAVLTLYDSAGSEVAYAGAFGYRQDPVIYYEVPADGEYVVQIRDALYRGREDFVYRISLGELPYLTGVFPLGGRAGSQVTVDLAGWNLGVDRLNVDAFYDRGRSMRWISVRRQEMSSNRMPFVIDVLPECTDREPNDKPETAQPITLPMIVNGRIDRPGDADVFRFDARARETIIAEVFARRLGSPLDSLLKLSDAAGHPLAANDDNEDKGAAFITHHADSRLSAALPAAGTYYLRLTDTQHGGGPAYGYRLHVRPPHPDFELRVAPSSVVCRAGMSVPITVYALRRDGFTDDILLELEGAPADFRLSGGVVPANQDKIRLTLTAPQKPTAEPLSIDMMGRASIHGAKKVHWAVPADAMTQAFAYQHLVPAKDWTVMVTSRIGPGLVRFAREERIIRLRPGGSAKIRVVAPGRSASEVHVELSEPPEGVTLERAPSEAEGIAFLVRADAKTSKPGTRGNLLFNALFERPAPAKKGKPATPQRLPVGFLPAVPYEIQNRR